MSKSVFSILDDLAQNVADLRQALSPLLALASSPARRSGTTRKGRGRRPGRLAGRSSGRYPRPSSVGKATRRKISPKGRAALKLAGQYMGLTRPLLAADKARVKAVREASGMAAAIKMAKKLRT